MIRAKKSCEEKKKEKIRRDSSVLEAGDLSSARKQRERPGKPGRCLQPGEKTDGQPGQGQMS